MIRPQPARWFDIVVARDDAFVVLEALAASGAAELERCADAQTPEAATPARLLKTYEQLARRYRAYWPSPRLRAPARRAAPAAAFEAALAGLARWAAEADPLIAELQSHETELARLEVIESVLTHLRDSAIDLTDLAGAGPRMRAHAFVYPRGAELPIPGRVLARRFQGDRDEYALVVGPPEALEPVAQAVVALHGRSIAFPEWLAPNARDSLALVAERRRAAERRARALREALAELEERHGVALALGDVIRATWCLENVGAIAGGPVLSHIAGWTSDPGRLVAAVSGSEARALAGFPAAPPGARAPLLLRNPWWARPFELFSRLLGVPSQQGADPSMVLAVVSPLLFGYMFGDVAQGILLIAAGVALRTRLPALRLLIPGGLASVAFGVLFGSVFGLEGWIEPQWLNPLAHPLPVLIVPIVAGAVFLALGLALNALAAYWRGSFTEWLLADAGLVAVYVGILLAFLHPAGAVIAVAGAVASVAGAAALRRRPAAALGALVERTLQILINTLSFARVGAFALGHAGLSAAVVALAAATGSTLGFVLVMAVGNALVVALEGLVVAIQTTRLILFEFFARFFESTGREFRPLLPPPVPIEER